MCDFGVTETLMAASIAMSVASAAASYVGQSQAASAQAAQNAQQTQLINQNRINQYNQAAQQEQYHNEEAYQKLYENTQQSRAAAATAMTSAGENGVDLSSNSVSALQAEYDARKGEFASDVSYNRGADISTLQEQMQGFNAQAQSQTNSERLPVYPSMIGTGLQIGSSAVSAYDTYSYRKNLTTQRVTPSA